jgi:hypothetical protein
LAFLLFIFWFQTKFIFFLVKDFLAIFFKKTTTMPHFHCFFYSISILVFKMEAMYICNGTTSIHVNPTPFSIEGLPILPFVNSGEKKQCCWTIPKIHMTYVINIFYPNLPRKDYGKFAKSPLPNKSTNYQLERWRKHILIGLLIWRSLMPRFFFPSFFSPYLGWCLHIVNSYIQHTRNKKQCSINISNGGHY